MRLWSIHPRYLDPPGLVALWREGLLAQAVLAGRTRGYARHPQLERFREARDPLAAIATYLAHVAREARTRGYSFDETRLLPTRTRARLRVTDGQVRYELEHLGEKLRRRNPAWLAGVEAAEPHPLFIVVAGPIAAWERVHF
jgi:Pyrimidine dimer DNA glycosylase